MKLKEGLKESIIDAKQKKERTYKEALKNKETNMNSIKDKHNQMGQICHVTFNKIRNQHLKLREDMVKKQIQQEENIK